MKRIGLISDAHSFWDDKFVKYFNGCDEIWHVGDIGSMEIAERLSAIAPLRAVYGNIDSGDLRYQYPEVLRFVCEGVDVLMKHIGGYPGRYDVSVRKILSVNPPKLFISGHSHILKAMYDDRLGCLHLNPGAAGMSGFHKVRTLMRFVVDNGDIRDLEVIEIRDAL